MDEDRAHRITRWVSGITGWLGSFPAILASVLLVVLWGLTGPLFGFSTTWQLLINTPTTIVTFWMAFIIQSTQNRDGRAIQTKLDAIVQALENAPNDLKGVEDEPESEIKRVQEEVRSGEHSSTE